MKWNQPFDGNEGNGFFVSFRCYATYVRLCFHTGSSLEPQPPKASKHPDVRYLDIHEHHEVDDDQLTSWIEQASQMPGEQL